MANMLSENGIFTRPESPVLSTASSKFLLQLYFVNYHPNIEGGSVLCSVCVSVTMSVCLFVNVISPELSGDIISEFSGRHPTAERADMDIGQVRKNVSDVVYFTHSFAFGVWPDLQCMSVSNMDLYK